MRGVELKGTRSGASQRFTTTAQDRRFVRRGAVVGLDPKAPASAREKGPFFFQIVLLIIRPASDSEYRRHRPGPRAGPPASDERRAYGSVQFRPGLLLTGHGKQPGRDTHAAAAATAAAAGPSPRRAGPGLC
jgi:hypothetical protein